MDKVKFNFLLLLYVFLFNSILSNQNDSCPYIHSGTYGIEWPNTTTKTLSKPACVDQNMEFLYRNCNKGMWSDEPSCFYVQSTSDCPDNFVSISDYCYTVTEETSYPPKCPYPNYISFQTYQKFFIVNKPFWMPVLRNMSYSLGFLQWVEPSELYKTEYKSLQTVKNGSILNKNCLVYYNSSYIAVESCENHHVGICAYKKLTKLQTNLCDDHCYLNDISIDATCICMRNASQENEVYDKAEFIKPYQNIFYRIVNDRVCAIGLERTLNGSYIWTSLQEKINYTFWSEDVIFDKTHVYGALTSKGWILTEDTSDCVLITKVIDETKPKGNLTFDSAANKLILSIANPRRINILNGSYLIFCFTDAHYTQLLYRYSFPFEVEIQENSLIVEFTPLSYGPGNYWCEYSAFPDYSFTTTNVVFVNESKKWGLEFVGIFSVEYCLGTNPLGSSITQFLDTVLFQGYSTLEACCISRIMKLISLDESTRTIQVNVHFTAKPQNLTDEEQYHILYKKIQDSFSPMSKDLKVELLALRSSNFCVSEYYKNLSWPQTPRGQKALSKEFCFDAFGQRSKRLCGGDFMDGAFWLPADDCEVMNFSSITFQLIDITFNISSDTCTEIFNLTEDFASLCMLDIYLIGDILLQWIENFQIDVECIVRIINNLLYIEIPILVEAEEQMMSSNLFLNVVAKMMRNQSSNTAHVTQNFAFMSYLIKDLAGLVVVKQDLEYSIYNLETENSIADIEKIPNIESAIILSSKFQKQFKDTDRITIAIFFNNSFFTQYNNEFRHTSLIFGVALPETEFALENPIQIINRHEMNKSQSMDHVCSYWKQDLGRKGFWVENSKTESLTTFQVCSYFVQHTFLALVFGPRSFFENNVTIQLLELYELDNFYSSTMVNLESISEYYEEFSPLDVFLVGHIFKQFNVIPSITDLESLATIIDNLHKIKPEILFESQTLYGATDFILQYLDSILQKFPSDVTLIRDSFAVIIYNVAVHNFSGIALIQENTTTHVQILDNKYDLTQITALNNLQSAIWVDQKFDDSLTGNQNMIITVFESSALFRETVIATERQKVSTIFGVHLSQTNLTESIVMIHKAISGYQQDCVDWNFSQLDSVRGHWKKDETITRSASYVQCKFFESKHFAFLIYLNKFHQSYILNIATDFLCSISIVGLCVIILTAIIFKKWRMKPGNQILLNFTVTLLFYLLIFDISYTFINMSVLWCTILAALLHYTKLAQLCWMLIIAMLQIKRYVFVLGGPPQYVLIKSCIFAWGFPIIPMICVLIIDPQSYTAHDSKGLCFASGLSLFLSVWLPCVIIIFFNFMVFVFILYNVIFNSKNSNESVKSDTILHIRLAVFLFFMLGLNWLFAVLANFNFGEIFYTFFYVSTGIQGFVIFLFFIVFNKDTRKLYFDLFRKCCLRRAF